MERWPPVHRDVHLLSRVARLQLLLPALEQQRAAVATGSRDGADGLRMDYLHLDPSRRAHGYLRSIATAKGKRVGLADRRLGGRRGVAARPVLADLGVRRGALLSRLKWLRLDVHWLLGRKHPDNLHCGVLVRNDRCTFTSIEERTGRRLTPTVDASLGAGFPCQRGVDDVFLGLRGACQHAVVRDVLPAVVTKRRSYKVFDKVRVDVRELRWS